MPISMFNNLYLIKSVIGCNCHCICMQHQPFSEKREKTVSMHYFHLSPGGKNINIRKLPSILNLLSKCKKKKAPKPNNVIF